MKEISQLEVLALFASGIGVLICTVGLQLIRERLVVALIHEKAPISQLISSWDLSSNGYVTVFAKGALWGEMSKEILIIKKAKKYLIIARIVSMARTFFFLVFGFFVITHIALH